MQKKTFTFFIHKEKKVFRYYLVFFLFASDNFKIFFHRYIINTLKNTDTIIEMYLSDN